MTDKSKIYEDFPIMLASPSKFLPRITYPAYAQTKMDGMRANIIIENGDVIVYSRNGKPMELHGRFNDIANVIDNIVLDGELLVKSNVKGKPKTLDRKTGNGILHKAVVGTMNEDEASQVTITLWDAINIDYWIKGKSDSPYNERMKILNSLPTSPLYSIVNTNIVNSVEHAEKLFVEELARFNEGLILKNMDHPWEDRRSPHLVKMKETLEMDLRVTDWMEGTGKYVGMMGALTCTNKDKTIQVSVGTGFLDSQRREYTREYSVGKIITVRYNAIIDRRTDKIKSLFLPVFQEFRPDKNEED